MCSEQLTPAFPAYCVSRCLRCLFAEWSHKTALEVQGPVVCFMWLYRGGVPLSWCIQPVRLYLWAGQRGLRGDRSRNCHSRAAPGRLSQRIRAVWCRLALRPLSEVSTWEKMTQCQTGHNAQHWIKWPLSWKTLHFMLCRIMIWGHSDVQCTFGNIPDPSRSSTKTTTLNCWTDTLLSMWLREHPVRRSVWRADSGPLSQLTFDVLSTSAHQDTQIIK